MTSEVGVVILAAGKGKRMGSNVENPKVLRPLLGKPLIGHLLGNIEESVITTKPVIVIAPDLYIIREALGPVYDYAIQETQLGTGHAVLAAKDKLAKYSNVLVLYGDHPLVTKKTIDTLVGLHLQNQADMTLATLRVPNFDGVYAPFDNYGRIVRDRNGKMLKSVEKKDTSEEECKITEVNPCFYVFRTSWLWSVLPRLSRDNAQQEYYLTDVLEIGLREKARIVEAVLPDPLEVLGVNTAEELQLVEQIIKSRLDDDAKEHLNKLPI